MRLPSRQKLISGKISLPYFKFSLFSSAKLLAWCTHLCRMQCTICSKNSKGFEVYLSNRPQVSMGYKLINHAGVDRTREEFVNHEPEFFSCSTNIPRGTSSGTLLFRRGKPFIAPPCRRCMIFSCTRKQRNLRNNWKSLLQKPEWQHSDKEVLLKIIFILMISLTLQRCLGILLLQYYKT